MANTYSATEDQIEIYVGLNADGEVVKTYNDCEDFYKEDDEAIVSWGVLTAIVADYDEIQFSGEVKRC